MCNAVMMGDDLAFVKAAADEVFPEYNAKQMDFSSQNNSSEDETYLVREYGAREHCGNLLGQFRWQLYQC